MRNWRKEFPYIQEEFKNKRIKQRRRSFGKWHTMELKLIDWIKKQREAKISIQRLDIVNKAKEILGDPTFIGSSGWFTRFKERWNIRKRISTHVVQKLKEDSKKEISIFLHELKEFKFNVEVLKKVPNKTDIVFVNMDEVSLQLEDKGYTYDFKGARDIPILGSMAGKKRMTVVLSITSTGYMLPPMIIFKGKTDISPQLQEKFKRLALIEKNLKGWMNESFMQLWLEKILFNLSFIEESEMLYLTMDAFSAHKHANVISKLQNKEINYKLIPPGCTSLIQPLDTHVNRSFKNNFRKLYHNWFYKETTPEEESKRITKSGYIKTPDDETIIEMILESLRNIDTQMIIDSFKFCGNFLISLFKLI